MLPNNKDNKRSRTLTTRRPLLVYHPALLLFDPLDSNQQSTNLLDQIAIGSPPLTPLREIDSAPPVLRLGVISPVLRKIPSPFFRSLVNPPLCLFPNSLKHPWTTNGGKLLTLVTRNRRETDDSIDREPGGLGNRLERSGWNVTPNRLLQSGV